MSQSFSFKNRILSRLPHDDLLLFLPHLQKVTLQQRTVLHDIGAISDYIYFLEDGIASIVTTMENGSSIEVGMVGFEGIVSVQAMLGDKISRQQIVIQVPANGFRLEINRCRAAFDKSEAIRHEILRFANAFLSLSTQTSACNRLHSVEQRLARWLLMSADRTKSSILPLTQDYLSNMLGVRRAGVTESAGDLQRAGLISYTNGIIQIIDRERLEHTACECYNIDRQHFDELML